MIVLSPLLRSGLMCPGGWPSFKKSIVLTRYRSPQSARSRTDIFNDDVPGIGARQEHPCV